MAASNFFVTGLPRSRTAWLANFLSYGSHSLCFHDGARYCRSSAHFRSLMKDTGRYDYVGDSDSALVYFKEEILAHFADAPLVFIARDPDEIRASMSNMVVDWSDTLDHLIPLADEFMRDMNPLVVRYEQLDDPGCVRDIVRHCTPSVPFDVWRYRMLNDMNVTVDEERYLMGLELKPGVRDE